MDGEREVPIPGAKPRALLALLLLNGREVVAADRLIDDLWGEAVPDGAANSLQSTVSKLRRALGPASEMLVTDAHGYRLDADAETLDANRFSQLVERGRDSARCERSDRGGRGSWPMRLALWRGPALDGLSDDGALRREALRLEELRLTALEDRCDADLRLGRHAELIAELGALVDAHPLRERLHGFLMLALYRAGRQGEALRAYQDAREVLGRGARARPGRGAAGRSRAAILAQDPSLSLPKAARTSARGSTTLDGRAEPLHRPRRRARGLGDLIASTGW